jgi:trigger factor
VGVRIPPLALGWRPCRRLAVLLQRRFGPLTDMAEAEAARTTVETVSELKKRVEVEVPAEEVTAAVERAVEGLRRRVKLRGFRAGHAPRPVLERLYGEQVRGEVVERLVRESYTLALSRHNVFAVGDPEIVVEAIDPKKPLRFSATVDVRPEVTVTDYEGIEVVRPAVHVDDREIEDVLARLRERFTELHPVSDRERVDAGDVITAEVSGAIAGEPVPGLRSENATFEAGRGEFVGALEERLVGLTKGVPATLEVSYPPDYPTPALAGKQVSFVVTVRAIARKELPALDDAFAARANVESLAALHDRVRSDLVHAAERRADAAVHEGLIDALIARHPFDVPEPMVVRRCDGLIESMQVRMPPEADRDKALAALRQELRPRALRQVKAALLLDALARQHGLEVGDAEVDARIDRIAEELREPRERVRALYAKHDRRGALRAQMLQDKALALLVERARIRRAESR